MSHGAQYDDEREPNDYVFALVVANMSALFRLTLTAIPVFAAADDDSEDEDEPVWDIEGDSTARAATSMLLRTVLTRCPFSRSGQDSDEEEDDEEGEEGPGGEDNDEDDEEERKFDESWGEDKNAYYDADVGDEGSADTDEEEEEEEEIKRLQAKKRQVDPRSRPPAGFRCLGGLNLPLMLYVVQLMREEDFADEELQQILQNEKAKPQAKKAKKGAREVVEEEVEQVEIDISKLSEEEKLSLLEVPPHPNWGR